MLERMKSSHSREEEMRSGNPARFRALGFAETRSRLENLVREIREGELTREKTQAVKSFHRISTSR